MGTKNSSSVSFPDSPFSAVRADIEANSGANTLSRSYKRAVQPRKDRSKVFFLPDCSDDMRVPTRHHLSSPAF